MTSHKITHATTLELAKVAIGRREPDDGSDPDQEQVVNDRFLAKVHDLQMRGRPKRNRRIIEQAQAAAHAAALPPVPPPTSRIISDAELESLFGGDDSAHG